MADEPFLSVVGVSRRFGATLALRELSLTVARGEIVALVGQSGCGKTTLLRAIAGIAPIDSGSIVLDGETVAAPGVEVPPERRGVGLMFQDHALFPHLRVAENVGFGLRRLPRAEAEARVADLLERLGIAALARRYPHQISGGEQQRVALARALAPRPRLLLMDEPFSALDRRLREGVREETLAVLRDLGIAALIVTHDPQEALAEGDRVALMAGGRILQIGTGPDLYDRPACAFAAEFFCPCNKIPGVCRGGWLETPLGRFRSPAVAEGGAATAYLRPHALRLVGEGEPGLAGRVVGQSFLGEARQIRVAADVLAEPLRVRAAAGEAAPPGALVRVAAPPEAAFVF